MTNSLSRVLALITLCAFFFAASESRSETASATSPNGRVVVETRVDGGPQFRALYDGREIVEWSPLGFDFHDASSDVSTMKVASKRNVDEKRVERVGRKTNYVDRFEEVVVDFGASDDRGPGFSVAFRAYDEGFAFRYEIPEGSAFADASGNFRIDGERTEFRFKEDWEIRAALARGFNTSQEEVYERRRLSDLTEDAYGLRPLLVLGDGFALALTESDLLDWSGLVFSKSRATSTGVAVRLTPRNDGRGAVAGKAPMKSPWLVGILGANEIEVVNNADIVQNTARPCEIDVSWIEPGNASWDWWAPKNEGRKITTERLKDFVDFSAKMGWLYTLVDAGWYIVPKDDGRRTDERYIGQTQRRNFDLRELVDYANARDVKILVWVDWRELSKLTNVRTSLEKIAEMGAVGVKIDFMDNQAQETVAALTETVRIAAELHLLVDYHGMYVPTGMERTFPNQITREGVRGNEYFRWSKPTAEHAATLPFTRGMVGPGDYTPGCFKNVHSNEFKMLNELPGADATCETIGTRAHELALCMILDSPFRCLCDLPENYDDEPGLEYLRDLPSSWDDTIALDGKVGEFYQVARRKGDVWFLSGITNEKARRMEVKLDMLDEGVDYEMTSYADGAESDANARAIEIATRRVVKGDVYSVDAAREGGWNIVLRPAR